MKLSTILTLSASAVILASCSQPKSEIPVYLDDTKDIEERVEDALSRMTLQEKIDFIHAQSKFSSRGVPRLGIPDNWPMDGPHGIRADVLWDEWNTAGQTNDSCTAFPALTALAATWNEDMSALYGKSIGEEARYRNKNILLGPGVNIYRTPLNGRNFEYMGEDPYLASKMVVPYIQEVQKNGVAACVKHYALNNQETNRHTVNVSLSDRALYEIYLPAFKAAVQQGHAWSIMGAYNRYLGEWACQNQRLLVDILRGEWGFDGAVVSDWGGVNNTVEAATKGMDLEFGSWTDGLTEGLSNAYDNYHLALPYKRMIEAGELPESDLDQKVRNVLRLSFRTTMDKNRPFGSFASPEHFAAARAIAEQGIVLLKNEDNILPVRPESGKKILVVGENAIRMMTVGGGSSQLKSHHETSPLQGIMDAYAGQAEVKYARGYAGPMEGFADGIDLAKGLKDPRTPAQMAAEAVEMAKDADVVFFIGGLLKIGGHDCEGADRTTMSLPFGQDKLISDIADVNPNLVFVNISGNAVDMPWIGKAKAVLQAWYLGSEAGPAIASVLDGEVNPSGKLPFTFYTSLDQCGAFNFGEAAYNSSWEVSYLEDIFVGYRWTEKMGVEPLFPFGHGLSYTTFEYGDLKVWGGKKAELKSDGKLKLFVDVKNTGDVAGYETVQLYIEDKESSLPRPVKELKGFHKVWLEPGQVKTVNFEIDAESLSFFDDAAHQWVAEPGEFVAHVAASSSDVRSSLLFVLK